MGPFGAAERRRLQLCEHARWPHGPCWGWRAPRGPEARRLRRPVGRAVALLGRRLQRSRGRVAGLGKLRRSATESASLTYM